MKPRAHMTYQIGQQAYSHHNRIAKKKKSYFMSWHSIFLQKSLICSTLSGLLHSLLQPEQYQLSSGPDTLEQVYSTCVYKF